MRGLALAAVLFVPSISKAEFVVDNFDAGTGVAGVTRSAFTTSGGGTLALLGGGILTNVASGAGSWTEFTLTLAPGVPSPLVSVLGYDHWLQLRSLVTVGDWAVTITARNAGLGDATPGVMTAAIADGSTSALVNLVGLSDVGNLNGLSDLTIRFTNVTDSAGSRVLSISQLAFVPEPATMTLLGLTAVGGLFVHRRRKTQAAA